MITLSVGPAACARSAPDSALGAAPTQWTVSGKSVSYVVTVLNRDSNCGAKNFTLAPVVPQGWSAALSNAILTINSGATRSSRLTVTPPANVTDGTYSFGVTVTHNDDPALSDTASGAIAVVSSLALNASVESPVFSVPGIAVATVNVDLSGLPVRKARVLFTITRPDGKVRKIRVRTNGDGVAKLKYRLSKRFPLGTYQVSASATAGGLNGSTSASFLLQ
jgi:hypothetical protein